MKFTLFQVLILCLTITGTAPPFAAAEGFTLPNLNPFAAKKAPTRVTVTDEPEKKSFLPSLPSINLLPKQKPGQPSTWQKMNKGTKDFFSKTVDVLTPWDNEPAKPANSNLTGSRRTYSGSPSQAKKSEPKKSYFPSLFSPKTEKKEIHTANDWLAQPRPSVPY